MLSRLNVYARKKHLVINTLKSEVVHFNSKGINLPRTTTKWAVLRECGHQPLQYCWLRAEVKLCNSMLGRNSSICRVVQANLKLQSKDDKCGTAQWMQAFQGGAISMNDFIANLKFRSQGVWREAELVDPRGNNNKLATYQAWFATPFACNTRTPDIVSFAQANYAFCEQLMDIMLTGEDQSQANQPNSLAEGVIAIKLRMKHMLFFTVLMNKFVLCAASITCFLNPTPRFSRDATFFAAPSELSICFSIPSSAKL
eukprot:1161063-Pelagomonas_calceolata.AAC.1